VTERHALLTIKDADKTDGGTYKLQLENSLGSDSANITFTVNGKANGSLTFYTQYFHCLNFSILIRLFLIFFLNSFFYVVVGRLFLSYFYLLVIILDTPDAPHGLVVEQGAGCDVTLSWLSPLNDGGSMVTEYMVEKKDMLSDKWIKVATTRYIST